ncbi:hypothetical protein BASA82_000311 [Batrachochytrium salamandrivorans]|nr:hypothetical protein BASA81_002576 [Batrachochytrium salamandrivorans]KAH9262664.1 hypothetical protein BASA82_000311 [Batrachochytrium salamandrivorans]
MPAEPTSMYAPNKLMACQSPRLDHPIPYRVMMGGGDKPSRHQTCSHSLEPYTYIAALPGKNVRDVLLDSFNKWLGVPLAKLEVVKQVVGMLHTASLVVDDIEDESPTRRGEPSAHVVFGLARALNAGNYAYFLALERVLALQSSECVEVFTREMLNLHRGQGRDIFWRESQYHATEYEYRNMVVDKTGGLFRLAIQMLFALSPTLHLASSAARIQLETNLLALSDDLACYFQIRDDFINLASPKFHKSKGFCEDITEGKLSFIVLHSLVRLELAQKQELALILQSKTTARAQVKRALMLLHTTGSFDYTQQYLTTLEQSISQTVSALGDNKLFTSLLAKLSSELDDCRDVYNRVIQ